MIFAQLQVITNHSGVPIYYTGPHPGVVHDFKLFKKYLPGDMAPGEQYLGDRAYGGNPKRVRSVPVCYCVCRLA